ncbi:MAG: ORF6N domain-containing protein [Treponema sp.]|nr:ORF6N domain-containing protein [Treponema sp.]
MNESKEITIQELIYEIRGQKVMLDSDLAQLYGVELKVMNQAVKRNIKRFPFDFMFQLNEEEWSILRSHIAAINLRSQNVTSSSNHGGRRYAPYVFSEQGVSMLSSVINSEHAIEININIMRAFVKLRRFVSVQGETNEQVTELRRLLMLHIDNCDYKFTEYDESINQIMYVLNGLIEQPKEAKRIGFLSN